MTTAKHLMLTLLFLAAPMISQATFIIPEDCMDPCRALLPGKMVFANSLAGSNATQWVEYSNICSPRVSFTDEFGKNAKPVSATLIRSVIPTWTNLTVLPPIQSPSSSLPFEKCLSTFERV